MSRKKREYRWFLEPLSVLTNETINGIRSCEFRGNLRVEGNRKLPLWQCPHQDLSRLIVNRRQLNLAFNVFIQEGEGKIRKWKFGKKNPTPKAMKKPKKLKRK